MICEIIQGVIFSQFETELPCIFVFDDSKQNGFDAFCKDSVDNGICIKNYPRGSKILNIL